METIKIGTCVSQPGQIVDGRLKLVTTPDGNEFYVPVRIAQGTKPGKTIFISAGIHGDELNGVELLHRFMRNFEHNNHIQDLVGTIIFLPILNPSGFLRSKREEQFSKHDFNRAFGEPRKKSISYKMADTIINEVISKCDYGLDLHDSGRQNVLLPHCRVHQEKTTGCTLEMGSIFGADIIATRKGENGMMAVEMHKKFGISIVTVEVGGGGILWNHFLDRSVVGIRNILIHFGFLSGKITLPDKQFVIDLDGRLGYRAQFPGLVDIKVHLGDAVEKGQLLACLYNPMTGEEMEIKAKDCGVVFSRRIKANVVQGTRILSLLEFENCPINLRKPCANGVQMIRNQESASVQVIESEVFMRALGLRV